MSNAFQQQSGKQGVSTWLQVAGITVLFGGLYVGLRNLPNAQCDFLHYEVVEVLADGTEVCAATNHAKFIDLDVVSYPVEMVLSDPEVEPDGTHQFTVKFLGKDNRPLLPHELAITHTERIHLMVVDRELEDYHHLHPEPMGASGSYSFSIRPNRSSSYRFFAELVPVQTKRQVVTDSYFEFSTHAADAGLEYEHLSPLVSLVGDYRFELELAKGDVRRKRDNEINLTISHVNGDPVVLQEIMGDYAHMVAFDSSKSGFAHMHPLFTDIDSENGVPEAGFLFYSPKTGHHRIWAQVKLEGQEVFAPFDLMVQ